MLINLALFHSLFIDSFVCNQTLGEQLLRATIAQHQLGDIIKKREIQIAARESACNMLLQLKKQRDNLDKEAMGNAEEDIDSDSVDGGFDKNNFGFKLLNQMGWTVGKGLGRDESGISDFIKVKRRVLRAGIGAEADNECLLDSGVSNYKDSYEKKNSIRKITLKRYHNAENS